jgi:hypothetical protein
MTSYKITMIQQQKVLAEPKDSAVDTGKRVSAGTVWTSAEKNGEYFKHSLGWVGRWKGGTLALSYEIVDAPPPIDPPPPVTEFVLARLFRVDGTFEDFIPKP